MYNVDIYHNYIWRTIGLQTWNYLFISKIYNDNEFEMWVNLRETRILSDIQVKVCDILALEINYQWSPIVC